MYLSNSDRARDFNSPPAVLKTLLKSGSEIILYHISIHPNATEEILKILASSKSYLIRWNAVVHQNATEEVLLTAWAAQFSASTKYLGFWSQYIRL